MLKGGISESEWLSLRVEDGFDGEDDSWVMKGREVLEGYQRVRLTEGQKGLKNIRIVCYVPGLKLKDSIITCSIHR